MSRPFMPHFMYEKTEAQRNWFVIQLSAALSESRSRYDYKIIPESPNCFDGSPLSDRLRLHSFSWHLQDWREFQENGDSTEQQAANSSPAQAALACVWMTEVLVQLKPSLVSPLFSLMCWVSRIQKCQFLTHRSHSLTLELSVQNKRQVSARRLVPCNKRAKL